MSRVPSSRVSSLLSIESITEMHRLAMLPFVLKAAYLL